MSFLARFRSFLGSTVRRRQMECDLDDELRFHVASYIEGLVQSGIPQVEAARRARLEFGSAGAIKEECRQALGVALLDELRLDLQYAVRILRKRPVFALTAVLTLAIGIGFNCAAFSVLNTILLHAPPYPDADRIVELRQANVARGLTQQLVSLPDYLDWKRDNRAFESMAAWNFQYFNLSGTDEPERVEGLTVTSEFFSVLGIQPAIGRSFVAEDDQPVEVRVAILSDSLWKRRFACDGAIIGRSVSIDGEPYIVVGVLPPSFRLFRVLNRDLDLYVPHTLDPSRSTRADHLLFVYGRRRPGVSMERARAEMDAIAAGAARQHPETNTGWTVGMQELHRQWTGQIRPTLLLLQVSAGVVLLIACMNLASLLLARTLARHREIAIRAALGAGRSRLFRQLLAEGITLGALSGIAGLAVGLAMVRIANRLPYTAINRAEDFRLDLRVLAFGLSLACLTGLLVGVAAAVQCSVGDLKPDAVRGRRIGNLLIFCQVAMTAMLLCAAGLLLHSSALVNTMYRGLEFRDILSAQVWLPPARYREMAQITRFWHDAAERVAVFPGVQAASVVNFPPLSVLSTTVGLEIEGRAARLGDEPMGRYWVIGPRYFETTRIPMFSGRTFNEQDNQNAPGVVIVSASMARLFWPGQPAVGRRLRPRFPTSSQYWLPKSQNGWLTVVGVAGDVRLDGIVQTALPQMYLAYAQYPTSILHLLVRTKGDPVRFARAVQNEVAEMDRDQPVFDVKSLEEILADSTTRAGVLTRLLGAFAAIAILLALIGIYGVTACWATRRTREIGIRIAIGARPVQVIRMIATESVPAVLAGTVVGLGGALLTGSILKAFLVGIAPADLLTFAVVPATLLIAATAAAYLPARIAAKIAPVEALKRE
jgi:putative ABC transport system permease protein